jgi:hypothetical protein
MDSSALFPAQQLSVLGAGHSPKPISGFDKGLSPNKIACLARQKSSGLMVDNPEKETPLPLYPGYLQLIASTFERYSKIR